jgi:flagellar biosynthesis protein FlhF
LETFTIQGKTLEQCKERAKELYGTRVQILNQKTIQMGGLFGLFCRQGMEVTGYVPPELPDLSKYALNIYKNNQQNDKLPADIETEKSKVLDAAAIAKKTDPKMQELIIEVKKLQEKLDEKMPSAAPAQQMPEHENIGRIRELLEQNDFTPAYCKKMIDRIRKEIPLDGLEDFFELQQSVLTWIGESVLPAKDDQAKKLPRIIVLVGPTGVGKTTTIVKLATRFHFGEEAERLSVGFITIDYYRVTAQAQLSEYAKILNMPVYFADSAENLKRDITLLSKDVDIILIDTAGNSPRDAKQLADTKTILDACGSKAEVHLAIAASTKPTDIIEIMRQFEPFAYKTIIVTKLDETKQIGNIISILSQQDKSISYLTNGQESTTSTIMKADVLRLLMNLDGFELHRARLEEKFAEKS